MADASALPQNIDDQLWWAEYLGQREVWASTHVMNAGKFTVIDDSLSPEDRYNRAGWLLRQAPRVWALFRTRGGPPAPVAVRGPLTERVARVHGVPSEYLDDTIAAHAYMRGTKLYGALVVGLPVEVDQLRAVALRARHRPDCPWRFAEGQQPCSGCHAGRTPPEISAPGLRLLAADVALHQLRQRPWTGRYR